MNTTSLGLLLLCTLLLSGCPSSTKHLEGNTWVPQGFAAYKAAKKQAAISPEGIVYNIRHEKNEPFAGLLFWKKAMKKRLLDTGYIFVAESDIQSKKQKGYLLELAAPVGKQDFTWLIALYVVNNKLHIVEASGEEKIFKQHRQAIVDAAQKVGDIL
ncbi:MAG: hypothetical protein Q9M28_08905 [Mariprofundaceae bacterium]|nr:hypothetical protein [Mariprofundaceae bacterium]